MKIVSAFPFHLNKPLTLKKQKKKKQKKNKKKKTKMTSEKKCDVQWRQKMIL